jgi:hypothetical protein
MRRVIADEQADEAAGIDEDAPHPRSRACTADAATCLYLSVERSLNSDRTLPATASQRA